MRRQPSTFAAARAQEPNADSDTDRAACGCFLLWNRRRATKRGVQLTDLGSISKLQERRAPPRAAAKDVHEPEASQPISAPQPHKGTTELQQLHFATGSWDAASSLLPDSPARMEVHRADSTSLGEATAGPAMTSTYDDVCRATASSVGAPASVDEEAAQRLAPASTALEHDSPRSSASGGADSISSMPSSGTSITSVDRRARARVQRPRMPPLPRRRGLRPRRHSLTRVAPASDTDVVMRRGRCDGWPIAWARERRTSAVHNQ